MTEQIAPQVTVTASGSVRDKDGNIREAPASNTEGQEK